MKHLLIPTMPGLSNVIELARAYIRPWFKTTGISSKQLERNLPQNNPTSCMLPYIAVEATTTRSQQIAIVEHVGRH